MYLSTVLGFVILWLAMVLTLTNEGMSLFSLVCLPALELVVLGGLGAVLISGSGKTVLALPALCLKTLRPSPYRPAKAPELVQACLQLSGQAAASGVRGLAVPATADPFLRQGIELVAAGAGPEALAEILATGIAAMEARHREAYGLLARLSRIVLGAGGVGTLIGILITLCNLADTSKLGPSIAVSLLSAFYGILLDVLVIRPLSDKLKLRSQDEAAMKRMVADGLVAVRRGEPTALVAARMKASLSERLQRRIPGPGLPQEDLA